MTKQQKANYENVEELKKVIRSLKGKKYRLDCGHHATIGHFLGNDIIIRNGSNPTIICSLCGY